MSDKLAPNPFSSAKRVSGISVMLKPSDIIDMSPGLPLVKAERLLNQHGAKIATAMIRAGAITAAATAQEEGTLS